VVCATLSAMSLINVPTICAPVTASDAVMLKVPLGFIGMALEDEELALLVGKEMGNVVPPMVMESGNMDDMEPPRPPKFIT